jgi:glycosyltransferase involved in cell wall biosynthesis
MKIVLMPSAYAPAVGGVEQLTHDLAERLVEAGDSVEVWVNRHPSQLPEREVIDGIGVTRFAMPMPGARPSELGKFAYTVFGAARRLAGASRTARPDVLHVQCFSGNGAYAVGLSVRLGVPLVVSLQGETVMDDHDIYERSTSLRSALRLGLRRASAVTACSQFILDDTRVRFGLAEDKGTVVPNGVVVAEGGATAALDLPFGRFVLGLGRVVHKKGFDLLLEAYARVCAGFPDVGLVIAGDGPARRDIAARAGELGIDHRVALPGALDRRQVAWAMRHAAAFVLPSRLEPFGIVVLEALRAGQRVIVSSRGGAPEIVRDGVEGLVVDPFKTDELARAIARLLTDGALGLRLSQAARLRAEVFAWRRISEVYRNIYAGVT